MRSLSSKVILDCGQTFTVLSHWRGVFSPKIVLKLIQCGIVKSRVQFHLLQSLKSVQLCPNVFTLLEENSRPTFSIPRAHQNSHGLIHDVDSQFVAIFLQETNPIFLFNKEMILSDRDPTIPKTTFSIESEIQVKVEESLLMPAVFHTVASRTQLALVIDCQTLLGQCQRDIVFCLFVSLFVCLFFSLFNASQHFVVLQIACAHCLFTIVLEISICAKFGIFC